MHVEGVRAAIAMALAWCTGALGCGGGFGSTGPGAAGGSLARGPRLTHGPLVAEVGATSALVWARADRPAWLQVQLTPVGDSDSAASTAASSATTTNTTARAAASARLLGKFEAQHDFTALVSAFGLAANTTYDARIWVAASPTTECSDPYAKCPSATARFRTAPAPSAKAPVRFVWGGDIGGQNACRDRSEGYVIFDRIRAKQPDFFVGLGDMIYADNACEAWGRYGNAQVPGRFRYSTTLESYREHWRYNRDDAPWRRLMATTSYVGVWDDHEVRNDFGPLHDFPEGEEGEGRAHLLPLGLRAFTEYTPLWREPGEPARLYRSVRWGKQLELLILDTRQYRDSNLAVDSAEYPKSLLGREQLSWLLHRIETSDAHWKVIVSSVPLSVPTGTAFGVGDGWADGAAAAGPASRGFERELRTIWYALAQHAPRHVWLTTDVHFAAAIHYQPLREHPSFESWEFIAGPLNAGVFPSRPLDPTFQPEFAFELAPKEDGHINYAQAKQLFNFGLVEIDPAGHLRVSIVDAFGRERYALTLPP